MEFALSDDQVMFQESVRGYLEKTCPLETVREVAAGDRAAYTKVADGVAELGVTQILVPEAHGGLGLSLLDAALVQEMLGKYLGPATPLATAMAVTGLVHAASEDQQAEWLPRIASGEIRFGLAVAEHTGARADAGITAAAGMLSGKSLFAMETGTATHLLVCDREGHLHIAEAAAKSVVRNQLTAIDTTRDFAEVTFDQTPAVALTGGNRAGEAADRMIETGRLLIAADSLGAMQEMLDRAVAYSLERKQFNRVIGSFQAVKHLCAEMAAAIEPARALIWHAAHAVDEQMDEADMMVCLAKSHLAETGTFVARTATEVHGGMGFTDLMGLHYWFKRIGTNRQLLGGPERIREEAARLQGWA